MDESDRLACVDSMQLEVLRRAIERKQTQLKSRNTERSLLLTQANDELVVSRLMTTLPTETVAEIFSYLYWIETNDEATWDGATTLQHLIDDSGTPDSWRELFKQCIPIAIATPGALGMVQNRDSMHLVGRQPRIFSIYELEGVSAEAMRRSSTTVFATVMERPNPEELQSLHRIPWHKLVLSTSGCALDTLEDTISAFMQHFGDKVAQVDHLEIHPLQQDNADIIQKIQPDSESKIFGEQRFSTPKVLTARLPLGSITNFRPILRNLSSLELCIISSVPEALRQDIDTLIKTLQPYSDNLISLTLSYTERRRAWMPVSKDLHSPSHSPTVHPTSFHQLRRLELRYFEGKVIEDILSRIGCPSLSYFSFIETGRGCSCKKNLEFNQCFHDRALMNAIHQAFPELESLAFQFCNFHRNAIFLEELVSTDETGSWLLPMLTSIELTIGSYAIQCIMLKILKNFVSSRLGSGSTKAIHSIHMDRLFVLVDSVMTVCVNTLKLLVPDVVIKIDYNT
ncbi:hypothetical protein SCHPADRAFT_936396 [Schizopora paradoxa]|uniref:Uncharacterized protein n=1 Tax=Schizopora paradoxa TaxID=27342 RepID=A0A0H2S1C6_9AGAM|nr:hypothetical protein SCHPADRAFT_936396 [Schizopora paradoxa]